MTGPELIEWCVLLILSNCRSFRGEASSASPLLHEREQLDLPLFSGIIVSSGASASWNSVVQQCRVEPRKTLLA